MKVLIGVIKEANSSGFGLNHEEKLDIYIYHNTNPTNLILNSSEFTYEITSKFAKNVWRINNINNFVPSSVQKIKEIQSNYLLKLNREETLNQILNG